MTNDPALWRLDFRDSAKLQHWLRGLRREKRRRAAVVIAMRAALRAAPLQPGAPSESFDRAIFATFWASAVAWVASRHPADADTLPVTDVVWAAEDIEVAGPEGSVNSASAAGCAASAVASGDDLAITLAGAAVDAACRAEIALKPGSEAIWIAASADVCALVKGDDPVDVADRPLWQEGAPDHATACWRRVRAALDAPHWLPWLDWYQRRLDGGALSPESERLFATLPSHPDMRAIAEQNLLLAEALNTCACNGDAAFASKSSTTNC